LLVVAGDLFGRPCFVSRADVLDVGGLTRKVEFMNVYNNGTVSLKAKAIRVVSASALLMAIGSGTMLTAARAASKPAVLTIATVAPFSGADAGFGLHAQSACLVAVGIINRHGGIMGHKVNCQTVDTKGDPADAVPVVEKLLATTSHLIGIIGPTSDEAAAVAPLINTFHIPFFSTTGQAEFDKTGLKYFHRLIPPDAFAGAAMALWAHAKKFQRVAIVVGNDVGSQGAVGSIISALAKLGSPKIVSNQVISLDSSSYNSEVAQLISSKPQAILTEEDPQTAATFFSELQQQLGTAPFPTIIGANPILTPEWYQAVSTAIGLSLVDSNVFAENSTSVTGGPAWKTFSNGVNQVAKSQPDVAKYITNATVETEYDSINLIALSAIGAHSTDPAKINNGILKLTNGSKGAKNVVRFSDGVRVLKGHKSIHYIGVTGPIYLNKYHNSFGGVVMQQFVSGGNVVTVRGSNRILNTASLAAVS
jgi:ABC-type branched-subunit amino acid transport system substrate-binding protein